MPGVFSRLYVLKVLSSVVLWFSVFAHDNYYFFLFLTETKDCCSDFGLCGGVEAGEEIAG